jgi:hypothetical protein
VADEELPRVTLGLLRRAETMCPRRLAFEHASSRKATKLGDAAFDVPNRIVEDAILWHKGRVETDRHVAFPTPTDLAPEQCALYEALARGYIASFPDADVEVADLGWSTEVTELGVKLVGQVGIPLAHHDGRQELRVVRVARRGALLDDTDIRFTLLRVRDWAKGSLHVVALDPLDLRSIEYDIDVPAHADAAHAWLAERVDIIRKRQHPKQAVAGGDCRHCACIPGCPAITRAT